jgi:hypothetical protein
MKIISAIALVMFIISCNNTTTTSTTDSSTVKLPAQPGSMQTVMETLKGKNYKTINAGTVSPFEMDKDNPFEWQDKITDSFTRNNLKEQMDFRLHFLNDTAVTFFDEGQEKQGSYILDTTTYGDEAPGIKLRIAHIQLGMGTDSMKVTYTYPVNGISDKQLFLQTPREINRRKVVVLMEEN